jgi:hypothetical protein
MDLEKSSFFSPIKNLAVLIVLTGIGNILGGLFVLIFSTVLGILFISAGIFKIILSSAIRRMKRWALYAYTAIGVATILPDLYYFVVDSTSRGWMEILDLVFEIAILVYLWLNAWRFKSGPPAAVETPLS